MNEQDQIIERLSAVQSKERDRSNSICSAAWGRVRNASSEDLAQTTADAWQLEAIHATSARSRNAAKSAMRTWISKTLHAEAEA